MFRSTLRVCALAATCLVPAGALAQDANALNGIDLLSGYLQLWTPGATYNTGTPTALGKVLLPLNLGQVAVAASGRTQMQTLAAYYDDRRNQSYSTIDGLGPLTGAYLAGSGAFTTIPLFDSTTFTTQYIDGGNDAGSTTGPLGPVVTLVKTLRGNGTSTTPTKNNFLYPRPWRQSLYGQNLAFVVAPPLVPEKSPTPASDSGFPSGHTNATYLSAFAMAYAIPERFQELLTRSSELGNDRILAGMHSPLDVVGGRDLATFFAVRIISDPANAGVLASAYAAAHSYLPQVCGHALAVCAHPTTTAFTPNEVPTVALAARILADGASGDAQQPAYPCALTLNVCAGATSPSIDRFSSRLVNITNWSERLNYLFPPIGPANLAPMVPANAETILATRQPYLTAQQRRDVLASTEIASNLPVLNDAQGYGRLNYVAAADGYRSFASDVVVAMDASAGGFSALDAWRNDISGPGGLTKLGTGTLVLAGNNSFAGPVVVGGGTLTATSATAFGTGPITVGDATLQIAAVAPVASGVLTMGAGSTLEMGGGAVSAVSPLVLAGPVTLAGKLVVNLPSGAGGAVKILGATSITGRFASVSVAGLPTGVTASVSYGPNAVQLVLSGG